MTQEERDYKDRKKNRTNNAVTKHKVDRATSEKAAKEALKQLDKAQEKHGSR